MNEDKIYNKEKIEFLKWQLGYVVDQIRMADNKINFLLAIYLAVLGLAISQIEKVINVFLNVCACWKIVIGIICFLFLCCIVKFFCYFINTIKPRTESKDTLGEKDYKSLIFWKDVASMKFENFKNTKLEELYNDMKSQVFINCSIAKAKFKNVNSAYNLLLPTLIIFMILFILTCSIGG